MGLNTAYGGQVVLSGAAVPDLFQMVHETAVSTDGGDIIANTWSTRPLNVVRTNEITGASLSGNQVTLPAGTYYIEATSEIFKGDTNKTRLRNVTDSVTLLVGMSTFARFTDNDGWTSKLSGKFTLSGTKVLELQHWTNSANPNGTGWGVATVGGDGELNTFAIVRIEKVS